MVRLASEESSGLVPSHSVEGVRVLPMSPQPADSFLRLPIGSQEERFHGKEAKKPHTISMKLDNVTDDLQLEQHYHGLVVIVVLMRKQRLRRAQPPRHGTC
jgi:hypothetical protein